MIISDKLECPLNLLLENPTFDHEIEYSHQWLKFDTLGGRLPVFRNLHISSRLPVSKANLIHSQIRAEFSVFADLKTLFDLWWPSLTVKLSFLTIFRVELHFDV